MPDSMSLVQGRKMRITSFLDVLKAPVASTVPNPVDEKHSIDTNADGVTKTLISPIKVHCEVRNTPHKLTLPTNNTNIVLESEYTD